ncbi:MAG: hypothetical protein HFG05_13055 [Oscillibacter sp.]|nr:hypothetical protein [Oscillibacter sp.]
MRNRFKRFALFICSALMVLPVLGLAAERELPPKAEIQALALDKLKCR